MADKFYAYYSSITEFEQGWGSRHDGYLVAITKEDFYKKMKEIHDFGSYECFCRIDDSPKLCEVTKEIHTSLLNLNNSLWTDKPKSEWLISE